MPGQTRRITLALEIKIAQRRCKCGHDARHKILKGEKRLVVKEASGIGEKGYCVECAKAMIRASLQSLTELETALHA